MILDTFSLKGGNDLRTHTSVKEPRVEMLTPLKVHNPKVNSFWAEDKPLIPLATCSIIPTSIIPAKGSVYVHACECVFNSIIAGEG